MQFADLRGTEALTFDDMLLDAIRRIKMIAPTCRCSPATW
jgi:hypothetical protein